MQPQPPENVDIPGFLRNFRVFSEAELGFESLQGHLCIKQKSHINTGILRLSSVARMSTGITRETTGCRGPMITPGTYRHYKGNLYEVIDVARHAETKEQLVVYRALYGARGLWVRPLAMFTEAVEVDGVRRPRFVRA